jgi:hypothetical protein
MCRERSFRIAKCVAIHGAWTSAGRTGSVMSRFREATVPIDCRRWDGAESHPLRQHRRKRRRRTTTVSPLPPTAQVPLNRPASDDVQQPVPHWTDPRQPTSTDRCLHWTDPRQATSTDRCRIGPTRVRRRATTGAALDRPASADFHRPVPALDRPASADFHRPVPHRTDPRQPTCTDRCLHWTDPRKNTWTNHRQDDRTYCDSTGSSSGFLRFFPKSHARPMLMM